MDSGRRVFLTSAAAGLVEAATVPLRSPARAASVVVKPARLHPGDAVALVNPVRIAATPGDFEDAAEALHRVGLRGRRMSDGGEDDDAKAGELNAAFGAADVKAILAVRGGWGSARLLPLLDYESIRRNPKVLMGYSDVGALLLAVHARSGLVTFHGPMGLSDWSPYTARRVQDLLFAGAAVHVDAVRQAAGFRTLRRGRARGRLVGGNLTVLTSMLGSPYLVPPPEPFILFLEEVREPLSEVDRMFTQLSLSGFLERAGGLVFGACTRCGAPEGDRSLTLEAVVRDHVDPLGVPAWIGAPIGHVEGQAPLPIGVEVEIDAGRGRLRLLEAAVS